MRCSFTLSCEAAPAGTTIEIGSIKDIPLYNADVDAASGQPAAVRRVEGEDRHGGWIAARQPRVQQLDPRRVQERDRLDVAAGCGYRPRLRRPPGRGHRRHARCRRHDADAASVAAGVPCAAGWCPFFGAQMDASPMPAKVFDEQGHTERPGRPGAGREVHRRLCPICRALTGNSPRVSRKRWNARYGAPAGCIVTAHEQSADGSPYIDFRRRRAGSRSTGIRRATGSRSLLFA